MALTQIFANQAQTTLAGAITPSSLTANLSPGSGALFPSPGANQYFTMIFNDAATGLLYEEVWVTNVTGDTITMIRGQEGSTALNWSAGDIAFNGWTAGSANNLAQQSQAQVNAFSYALDTGGAANTYAIALTPSMATGVDGAIVYFNPAHTNTGASTLTVNAGTSYPLLGTAQQALQGGEVFQGGFAAAEFNSSLSSYVLLYCTGGALQVANAVQSQQAITLAQANSFAQQPGQRGEFYMTSAPAGWLKANSAAIPVATYANLTAAIYCGDANNATASWGYRCTNQASPSTSRSTTGAYIVLPEGRGEFSRGWDDGRGVDSGRSLWSMQAGQVVAHNHTASASTDGTHAHIATTGQLAGSGFQSGGSNNPRELNVDTSTSSAGAHNHAITVNATGGTENMVRNSAALVCIKY